MNILIVPGNMWHGFKYGKNVLLH